MHVQVLVQGLLLQLWGPLQSVGGTYRRLRKALVDVEDFIAILRTPPSPPDGTLPLPLRWQRGRPTVLAQPSTAPGTSSPGPAPPEPAVEAARQSAALHGPRQAEPWPRRLRHLSTAARPAGRGGDEVGMPVRGRRWPKMLREARGAGGVLQRKDAGAASVARQHHGAGGPVQGGVGAAPASAAEGGAAGARAPPAGKLLPGLHVEFRDVSFSYCAQSDRRHGQQQQPQQLANLTFAVLPGECIAVVGPPGTHPPAHSRPACEAWAEVAPVVKEMPRSITIQLHPDSCNSDQAH